MHRQPRLSRQTVSLAVLAATTASTWLAVVPASAAAPATCQGKAVTIVATAAVTRGTDGDDVVAMEPGGWNRFDAGAGHDTICLDVPAEIVTDHYGGRDRIGDLDAGEGDDTVVNLMPAGTAGITTNVVLGPGSDSYQGAGVGERVHAEKGYVDATTDPALTGPQRDVVSGAAKVWTAAPADGVNTDRITFGAGPAWAVVDGRMGPDGLLDFTATDEATLELPVPDRLRGATGGGVVVDNQARQVAAGSQVLAWQGEVSTFLIGTPTRVPGAPVSFLGGAADETVRFQDSVVGDVDLGAGDDTLGVQGLNLPGLPSATQGGPGRDVAYLETVCAQSVVVRLDDSASCDGRSGSFSGVEEVVASSYVAGSRTRLVGTRGRDVLRAFGDHAVVDGRGGADTVSAVAPTVRARGGNGADRMVAIGLDVVVRGQRGGDRIEVREDEGRFGTGAGRRHRVALGGPGRDRLVGGDDARPDRLLGGAGRDRVDGGGGRHDYCVAEITRRCERP